MPAPTAIDDEQAAAIDPSDPGRDGAKPRVTMQEQALCDTLSESSARSAALREKSSMAAIPQVGDVLEGRYRILAILGDGGFGVVFKGLQLATEQMVAIKVLLPERLAISEKEASSAAERFRREMKIVGDLRHRNIVKLVDSGTLESGLMFMVLEYVEGQELSALIRDFAKRGELIPRAESKRLMMQVLSALSVAHGKGYVHRDLKPQNIMVSTSGFERDAVVLDFGIAGVLEQAQGEDHVRLTKTRQALGTVSYMSREQALGQTLPQTDIYAWGLIFLECLTGHVAVVADTPYAAILVHCSDHPIPIPEPIASHPIGAIIAKATAKSLDERYHDVKQLYDDLARCELGNLELSYSGTRPVGQLQVTTGGGIRVANSGSLPQDAVPLAPNPAPASHNRLLLAILLVGLLMFAAVASVAVIMVANKPPTPPATASNTPSPQPRPEPVHNDTVDAEATAPLQTNNPSTAADLSAPEQLATPDAPTANDASQEPLAPDAADQRLDTPDDNSNATPSPEELEQQVTQLKQLAFRQMREKRQLEAIETLSQALALKEDFVLLMSLGLAQLEAGRACQAIPSYQRASELQPDNPLPKDKLAEANQGCKRRD